MVCKYKLFVRGHSRGGQPKSDILRTHADRGGGGGCPKKLIQDYTLDERKNEVNGSNHEINL